MMEKLELSHEMEAAERAKLEQEIRAKQEEVQRIQSEVEAKDAEARRLQAEFEAAKYEQFSFFFSCSLRTYSWCNRKMIACYYLSG